MLFLPLVLSNIFFNHLVIGLLMEIFRSLCKSVIGVRGIERCLEQHANFFPQNITFRT